VTKVKICGLSKPCDIEAVNEYKPDFIGFVLAENSRRKITPNQALRLREKLDPYIVPVGVFVDETIESIIAVSQSGAIDIIQLHGSESENYIQRLKALTDKPVIKAVAVQNRGDVQKWDNTIADFLLLDSQGGGSGKSFDWDLIGEVSKPYFLAGGLGPETADVSMPIKRFKPSISKYLVFLFIEISFSMNATSFSTIPTSLYLFSSFIYSIDALSVITYLL
jgi:phosphoribosylanthranilate isomerase